MVDTLHQRRHPFGLVVTGQAEIWQDALRQIVGPQWLRTYQVRGGDELLQVVQSGLADAAVLDDSAQLGLDVMQILRMIRRLSANLPVVVVTQQVDRRTLENALRLAAFSVVSQPLELEELLRQIRRMMVRLDQMLRYGRDE
jgi:DNA-binding NtrC family response regulator